MGSEMCIRDRVWTVVVDGGVWTVVIEGGIWAVVVKDGVWTVVVEEGIWTVVVWAAAVEDKDEETVVYAVFSVEQSKMRSRNYLLSLSVFLLLLFFNINI